MSSRVARTTIVAVVVVGLLLVAYGLGILHGIAAALPEPDFGVDEEPPAA